MRPARHVPAVFVAVFCLVLTGVSSAATASSTGPDALLAAVNRARASHGLAPLRADPTLRRAAESHTMRMLRSDVFAHGAFAQRMQSFHAHGPTLGENLAWGTGSDGTATAIVREWLASPHHRANLLRPGFRRIGLGVADGTFLGHPDAVVVTADFGGR